MVCNLRCNLCLWQLHTLPGRILPSLRTDSSINCTSNCGDVEHYYAIWRQIGRQVFSKSDAGEQRGALPRMYAWMCMLPARLVLVV
jgi:hypothetical protein